MEPEQTHETLLSLLDRFPDEASCVEHFEKLRWPDGPICQWCGEDKGFYRIARGHKLRCKSCSRDFSVRKGTIFEDSRLPLRKWLAAIWLLSTNRKGIPSTQLAREIGVTQKTAWFMLQRIRKSMEHMNELLGMVSGIVEADETYVGGRKSGGPGTRGKMAIVGAVSRSGHARADAVEATHAGIAKFVAENVQPGSTLCTDEHIAYRRLSHLYRHLTVNHTKRQWRRGIASTNRIESFWSLFKRGWRGIYHIMSGKHLHRYAQEHAARWNMMKLGGEARVDRLLRSSVGRRLTWRALIA